MKPVINLVLDTLGKQIVFYLFVAFIIAGFLAVVVLVVQRILARGGKIQTKGLLVTGGTDGSVSTPAKIIPPHVNCPHSGDIMAVVAKTTEYVEICHKLPLFTVEHQMKYFEEKEVEIQGILLRAFIKEMDDILPEGTEIVQHPEYIAYNATLIATGRFLKDYVRVAMRQNHFSELSGDAWIEKNSRYVTMIQEKGTELLNLYWRGDFVPRWRPNLISMFKRALSKSPAVSSVSSRATAL